MPVWEVGFKLFAPQGVTPVLSSLLTGRGLVLGGWCPLSPTCWVVAFLWRELLSQVLGVFRGSSSIVSGGFPVFMGGSEDVTLWRLHLEPKAHFPFCLRCFWWWSWCVCTRACVCICPCVPSLASVMCFWYRSCGLLFSPPTRYHMDKGNWPSDSNKILRRTVCYKGICIYHFLLRFGCS